METLAPPVVAVVVAHDPGPWFEETLASLGSQDYAELSVLVLDNASTEDQTARVAAVFPSAFVRRFESPLGYGAISNEVRTMVDGAAYFLFCHDDVALFPDTVHLLVEESFRSNAGIVSPKVVGWEDPTRLLHVGMAVDKGGSVVDRVQAFEIDHGQHDAVRDVFVAPGGCTLVRADLFEELDGFDPAIVAMGEDLDLGWRAQVAGARVVVAPAARVRHRQELAGGGRSVPAVVAAPTSSRDEDGLFPTIQGLQRRHELLAVLKCYGSYHRLRIVPQLLLLSMGEYLVALLAGNRLRSRAVAHAWAWNLGRLGTTRRLRKKVQATRRLSDGEIRLLQLGGSARLSSYVRRLFQHGFHADDMESLEEPASSTPAGTPKPDQAERRRLTVGATAGWGLAAALVVLVGSRSLMFGSLPSYGQFVPFPNWSGTFGQFVAGWHPSGVGSTAPATPALAVAGIVGTVLLGAMGLTQKVLLFGCIPLGAWGLVRLLRPFGSQRASLVAGIAYLAVPLPYDALALGRLGALALYGGAPWVLGHLFRVTGLPPYALSPREGARGWLAGHRSIRAVLLLGIVEAILASFAPAAAVVVGTCAVALVASSVVAGGWGRAARTLWMAVGSTVVAALLCLPWLVGVLLAGHSALTVLGVASPTSEAASWGTLLRFSVGPIGDSPLGWGFAAAALLPLLLARSVRFSWAARCWTIALVFWVAAWAIGRGWLGGLAIDPMVLLAPAAVAVAMAIGLGIAAFEEDLRTAAFGWRQFATGLAAVIVVVGTIPTLVSALPGRWDVPQNDFAQSLAWMHAKAASGAFRVLWLGDPRSLNQGSWSAGGGLAYATSEDGAPDATWLWNAASPGPASQLATSVNQARHGRTDRLGAMLAPAGVRYVVAVTASAPIIPQLQTPWEFPLPAGLSATLGRQLDLNPILSATGITVYANTDWLPIRSAVAGRSNSAERAAAIPARAPGMLPATVAVSGTGIVPRAVPVLVGASTATVFRGIVPQGAVLSALAPAGRWELTSPSGSEVRPSPSFGWGAQYHVTRAGEATLRFEPSPWSPAGVALQMVLWLLVIVALIEGRGVVRPRLRWGVQRLRQRQTVPGSGQPPRLEPPGGPRAVEEISG